MNILRKLISPTTESINNTEKSDSVSGEALSKTECPNENNNQSEEASNQHIYTIYYGTQMPIDAIYMFLDKNFEDKGYEDAMCSMDNSYKESGEQLIRNELRALFRRVTLRYKKDQRELTSRIRMVRQQGLLDVALDLEGRMDTVNEHLAELQQMEKDLNNNESSMMRPIESYRRGFLKGLTARANELLKD